jgi:hypothetical protein
MNRTYKLTASRGNQIVFDDRLEADNPRHARREMKRRLGLESLSGIVYSLTEIPEDLIRQIVDARIAELAGGAPILPSRLKGGHSLGLATLRIRRRRAQYVADTAD